MKYLISTFNCDIYNESIINVKAFVKYKIHDFKKAIVFPEKNSYPFVIEDGKSCENFLIVRIGLDTYNFLFSKRNQDVFVTQFNFKSKIVSISLSNKIFIAIDGVLICEKTVETLNFSHYEIIGNICLIYFEGVRNFIVVIEKEELKFAEYCDECNTSGQEKYFMCRLYDSLNHGTVCHIKENSVETYLVYLDDESLNLKQEFIPFVFLDCIKSKNYLYANSLLSEDLKLEDAKNISNFVPEFEWFYPAGENEFILIKKNTLAGILTFDIDKVIVNIVSR